MQVIKLSSLTGLAKKVSPPILPAVWDEGLRSLAGLCRYPFWVSYFK